MKFSSLVAVLSAVALLPLSARATHSQPTYQTYRVLDSPAQDPTFDNDFQQQDQAILREELNMQYELAERYSTQLAGKSTALDSLRLYIDIYDLSPLNKKDSIGLIMIDIAARSGNDMIGLDAIRTMAALHVDNDSLLQLDLQNVERFAPSQTRRETETFVKMEQNIHKALYGKPEERDRELRRLIKELNVNASDDLLENIERYHAIALFMQETAKGDFLRQYFDRLEALIDQLRPEAYDIRNLFYNEAALAYFYLEEYDDSKKMDFKLLDNIKQLERGAEGMRHQFFSHDANKYYIYTRLLANYPSLSPAEVEEFYQELHKLIQRDAQSAYMYNNSKRTEIYYSMYKKDYPQALELLKQYIDSPTNLPHRKILLKMMIQAARETNDRDALLAAMTSYNKMLESSLESDSYSKSKELEFAYDLRQIRDDNVRKRDTLERRYMFFTSIIIFVLIVLLFGMLFLWRHSRRQANIIRGTNEALRAESENLKKTQKQLTIARDEAERLSRIKSDFIKNLSGEVKMPIHAINEYTNLIVDCSGSSMKSHLRHFADLVIHNTELLTTIIQDVISLSEIDSEQVPVKFKKVTLHRLLSLAIDSVKHKAAKGVEVILDPASEDVTIDTDQQRFLQVLVHLLSNAIKFTPKGKIVVGSHVDKITKSVNISVTDTGIGIAPEYADHIFERFVKLDLNSQGVGIGLSVSRHITELLGGNLSLDTEYTDGARFVINLPLDHTEEN